MKAEQGRERIGAFICNYNKADYVVKCIQALKDQTYKELDIFVVDNASTDRTVEKVRERYGGEVTILANEENLGGSGGFGRGIRTALELGYAYFLLVDNDAFLDVGAVESLYEYMQSHGDVGICGAQTLCLQDPERIQDLGGRLDMERYRLEGIAGGMRGLGENLVLECDYVASCAALARTEAVRRFGGFPEKNFIYWDDVEWCTKCRQAGYKVVVNGHARAYHDLAGATVRNMFLRYYADRNRYRYFLKYLPQERLDAYYNAITGEFFLRNYGAMQKGKHGTVFTEWNALDDFLHGVSGKAAEGKIVPYTPGRDRLREKVVQAERVLVHMPCQTGEDYGYLNSLLAYLTRQNPALEIRVVRSLEGEKPGDYDMTLQMCGHVTQVRENILPVVYVDPWRNCILDERDYGYYSRYEEALAGFREMYRPLFREQRKRLRGETDA